MTQDKDGNKASESHGHSPDDESADESSPRKPVRPARRPPNMPPATAISAEAGRPGGFFHIRKKGQGYWTRMGTVGGAALIGAMTIQFIFGERATFNLGDGAAEGLCAIFAIAYSLSVFYFMNRPTSVDFLIATDSEMKKVNWTSRAELIGSTKVIIFFMLVIAAFLFVMDVAFGYLFWAIGVVKERPL